MKITGTLINYYFHCKRQCYLSGNRINLEDESEDVKIGKAIHESKLSDSDHSEISIENIKLDKITDEYITEIKKSDADVNAAKWQLIYYMWILKNKGIIRKGKLEFVEKNKTDKKVLYFELNDDIENELKNILQDIENLFAQEKIPGILNKPKCKKCAYYNYCYI